VWWEQAAAAGADLDDFLRGINRPVIDVERLRHAAFIQGRAPRGDQRGAILGGEELAVAADARGVVE